MARKPVLPEELVLQAQANGISRRTLYARHITAGWDAERAATAPLMTRSEVGRSRSMFTPEELEHIKSMGMKPAIVRNRIKEYGWSREEALHTPIMTNREAGKRGRAVLSGLIPSRREKTYFPNAEEIEPPEEVIELSPEEYRAKRAQLMAMLETAATQEEYERIGSQLLTFKRRK